MKNKNTYIYKYLIVVLSLVIILFLNACTDENSNFSSKDSTNSEIST